jgi:signal-transduction protein with cAMP-binding, CBS, and nucleotidyltransferase domain
MQLDAVRENPAYKEVPLDYIEFAEVDDIWVRAYSVSKAKTIIAQHVHEHDHMTLVSRGAVEAWQDGELLGEFKAPAIIKISAGKSHAFAALTDDVVLCCLHNLRGTGLESPKIKEI